jgi:DNA-binding transcriptional regulator YiaG
LRGVSRRDFSRLLGVDRSTIDRWETGSAKPKPATLRAVLSGTIGHEVPSPDLIRRARRLARLKQREAATLLEMTRPHWQAWESGLTPMPALKWALFLKLAGLPADLTLDYDPLQKTKGLYR